MVNTGKVIQAIDEQRNLLQQLLQQEQEIISKYRDQINNTINEKVAAYVETIKTEIIKDFVGSETTELNEKIMQTREKLALLESFIDE